MIPHFLSSVRAWDIRSTPVFFAKDVLGLGAQYVLTMGAPEHAISKSAGKNVHDFCRRCREAYIENISETVVVQPSSKKDGSPFTVVAIGYDRGASQTLRHDHAGTRW